MGNSTGDLGEGKADRRIAEETTKKRRPVPCWPTHPIPILEHGDKTKRRAEGDDKVSRALGRYCIVPAYLAETVDRVGCLKGNGGALAGSANVAREVEFLDALPLPVEVDEQERKGLRMEFLLFRCREIPCGFPSTAAVIGGR